MLLIAQDPGKRTGIATYDTETKEFMATELEVEEYFDWMHETARVCAERGQEVRMVSESFIITVQTAKNSQAGWSLELIGVMKFIAHRYGFGPVKLQAPNVAKTFATDGKLHHVGWYSKSRGHANDAARHLMTYAVTNKLVFGTDVLMELAQG